MSRGKTFQLLDGLATWRTHLNPTSTNPRRGRGQKTHLYRATRTPPGWNDLHSPKRISDVTSCVCVCECVCVCTNTHVFWEIQNTNGSLHATQKKNSRPRGRNCIRKLLFGCMLLFLSFAFPSFCFWVQTAGRHDITKGVEEKTRKIVTVVCLTVDKRQGTFRFTQGHTLSEATGAHTVRLQPKPHTKQRQEGQQL